MIGLKATKVQFALPKYTHVYIYTRANNTHRFRLTRNLGFKLRSHGFYHQGYFSIEIYHFRINTHYELIILDTMLSY